LKIYVTNGLETLEIVSQDSSAVMSEWVPHVISLHGIIDVSDSLALIVETADIELGNILEVGFDDFKVLDIPLSIEDRISKEQVFFPNPAYDVIYFTNKNSLISNVNVTDVLGNVVLKKQNYEYGYLNISHLPKGTYFIQISIDGLSSTRKIVKY